MIDLKNLVKSDPVTRNVEKGLDQSEHTPMDPPSVYEKPVAEKVTYENMAAPLKQFMDEHKVALQKIEAYEKALVEYKANGYKLTSEINTAFSAFFKFFDENISLHNHKEEKALFPLLNKKLIAAGEHSVGDNPMTAIDVMEDDHIKFIQLGALAFNFFGLATRIQDERSRIFILDTAYENARELVELLKLHIYREDHTLFPLAQKYLNAEELSEVEAILKKFN
jgi:hemerythrin-like domain-containing protein